jgi:hypothetical protein
VPYQANSALAVTGNVANQALDVRTVTIGGSITLNGAVPTTGSSCTGQTTEPKAQVDLVDATHGYAFSLPVACSATSFTWSGAIYRGQYRLTARGTYDSGFSNLSSIPYLKAAQLAVNGDLPNQVIDVRTVAVAGTIRLDGATAATRQPYCTSYPAVSKALVRFTDASQGYAFALVVPCSAANFAWQGAVYPGTYAVAAAGVIDSNGDANSALPGVPYLAAPRLAVP